MPANINPVFTITPVISRARLTAANTARDGSGTVAFLCSGNTNGTRIDKITFTSAQASAAANSLMVGRVFISDNSGANYRLYKEVVIVAVTASNTAIGAQQQIVFTGGLVLPSGVYVGVTQSVNAGVADQVDVIAEGGDF